jgi:DNA-binding NarL/FixJ family response regulator
MSERIRILVVEDQFFFRVALRTTIDAHGGMQVVAETGNGTEAVALFREVRPDVTIMDIRLPGMSGLEAMAAIRREFPGARVLVLSNYDRSEDIYRALGAGAMAYLTKDAAGEELVQAIQAVHRGKRYLPAAVGSLLAERTPGTELTERESGVLRLLAEGRSNREIAEALGIAENTTRIHVSRILDKLGASDRTQAVVLAIQRGIVHLE